jgi:hypothetical protein
MIDSNSDETVIGPSLAMGLLYQYSDKLAFGAENMKMYSWTGKTYKGAIAGSDILLMNIQYAF